MALSVTYPFTTSTNYTFDSTKVAVSGGSAALILIDNTGQTHTEDFATDTGFTYSASLIEFTGGLARQIKNGNNDATCAANFNSTVNLNWGDGTLTGTAVGGAVIAGGELDVIGGTKYVEWSATGNSSHINTGTIKFKLTPNYSGTPGNFQSIYFEGTDLSNNDMILVSHSNVDGSLTFLIRDSTGTNISSVSAVWNPTLGTQYEIEYNYDVSTGAQRAFVDGTQHGSTETGTGTRAATNIFRLGGGKNGTGNSNFTVDDLIISSTVQHTANYTAGYTINDTAFQTTNLTIPTFSYSSDNSVGLLQELTAFTTTQAGSLLYNLGNCTSGYMYWNGTSWQVADGTSAQANTSSVINTNLSEFQAGGCDDIGVKIFFTSTSTQANVSNLDLNYTGQIFPTDNQKVTPNSSFSTNEILTFTETTTQSASDLVKYTIQVAGQEKYISGGSWANSNGTYAQSTSASGISDNITDLLDGVSPGVNCKPIIYLHSDDGSTTPSIDNIDLTYDFQAPTATLPSTCTVYGWVHDNNNVAISGLTIEAALSPQIQELSAKNFVLAEPAEVTTDSSGYWEVELVQSPEVSSTSQYVFTFTAADGTSQIFNRTVPAEETKEFLELDE